MYLIYTSIPEFKAQVVRARLLCDEVELQNGRFERETNKQKATGSMRQNYNLKRVQNRLRGPRRNEKQNELNILIPIESAS